MAVVTFDIAYLKYTELWCSPRDVLTDGIPPHMHMDQKKIPVIVIPVIGFHLSFDLWIHHSDIVWGSLWSAWWFIVMFYVWLPHNTCQHGWYKYSVIEKFPKNSFPSLYSCTYIN